jgi:hypothetical protein
METRFKPDDIGRGLAHGSDEEQALVLNEFGRALHFYCKGENGMQNQICMAADKLDFYGMKLIEEFAGFVALKREELSNLKKV